MVGAWQYALGNQACKGKNAILIRMPRQIRTNATCMLAESAKLFSVAAKLFSVATLATIASWIPTMLRVPVVMYK